MKQQMIVTKKLPPSVTKPPGAEAALSLQEELVAAIQGAFEVAVEIAAAEVKKLVAQATGGFYDELRRENESLKQKLQRAEAALQERRGSSPRPANQLPSGIKRKDQPSNTNCTQIRSNPPGDSVHCCAEVRGDTAAGHSGANLPPAPQHQHRSRNEDQRSNQDCVSEATTNPEKQQSNECITKEVTEEISNVCVVKFESTNPSCQNPEAQDNNLPPLPSTGSKSTLVQVTVKQENLEETREGSSCCLDLIKIEDFSLECMSAVQSTMLEEWKPEVPDIHSPVSNAQLSSIGLDQDKRENAHSPNPTSLPTPTDLPSLSSEFPNVFQVAEPAPVSEAPPRVYGVHLRTNSNLSHTLTTLYACKACGQTFHLPSLLRRHYGQCQQRLQQRSQQPSAGNKRTRLQLYPPGCSPFRCTVCNREFNRLENLKTHLRIHTGERPYTCSVCSKCFRHSGALTRHFRIHTGEKPYICGQCGKSFRNCGGLKFHQRSHSKQLQ